MKKTAYLTALIAIASATLHAATIEFNAAEGYTSGNIKGQNGWGRVFGNDPLIDVDPTGSGSISQVNNAGAIFRSFSDAEVGAAFDDTSSIINYQFDITYASTPGAPVFNGWAWGIGAGYSQSTELDVSVNFRDDGRIEIRDGVLSGNDRIMDGDPIDLNTQVTLDLTVDWGDATYTVSRSDDLSATRTDFSFVKGVGGNGGNWMRVDSATLTDSEISSFTIAAIPEPGTLSLLGIALVSLLVLGKRRL